YERRVRYRVHRTQDADRSRKEAARTRGLHLARASEPGRACRRTVVAARRDAGPRAHALQSGGSAGRVASAAFARYGESRAALNPRFRIPHSLTPAAAVEMRCLTTLMACFSA